MSVLATLLTVLVAGVAVAADDGITASNMPASQNRCMMSFPSGLELLYRRPKKPQSNTRQYLAIMPYRIQIRNQSLRSLGFHHSRVSKDGRLFTCMIPHGRRLASYEELYSALTYKL